MIEIYQIERIARLVICGILPLCVILASLILIIKKGVRYSIDEDCIKNEMKAFVLQMILVVILWGGAYVVLNRYYYSTVLILVQNVVNVTNPHICRWIINCVMDLLVLIFCYKFFIQI